MKINDKNRKSLHTLVKTPITTFKKVEVKKVTLKKEKQKEQQPILIKSNITQIIFLDSIQPTLKNTISSATQSSKLLYPSTTSLKNSPKASLNQIKSVPIQKPLKCIIQVNKIKKIQIPEKNKEEIKKSLANVIKIYYPPKKNCLDISMTQITKDNTQKQQKITKNEYNLMEIIGEGGYGKVWKVQNLKTKKLFAMKQMSKAIIIMKKSVDNVLNQRKILQDLKSTFIANMSCAFNDRDNLYLVMDLLGGADLRYRIGYVNKFTQEQTKFLIACIMTAVQYIHRKKIFHRDIKPQNLVFDDQGYLRLTDFGIARAQNSKQNLDASGTPGYMAPEVLCKQMHSYEVDFYAIGIITYELMMGKRPYYGNNRNQIRDAILSKQHCVKKVEIPSGWSIQSADFINRLISRTPANRLGSKSGVKQLKLHPWFQGYNWNDLELKKISSPFKEKELTIQLTDRLDQYSQAMMQYKLLQRVENKVDAFAKYYFQSSEK